MLNITKLKKLKFFHLQILLSKLNLFQLLNIILNPFHNKSLLVSSNYSSRKRMKRKKKKYFFTKLFWECPISASLSSKTQKISARFLKSSLSDNYFLLKVNEATLQVKRKDVNS